MSQTKEDIIRRVKALMEKTTAAGCSEAEAMTAAETVSRLMNKYDLQFTDIKLAEQANCQEADYDVGFQRTPTFYVCNCIAYLTDTRAWVRTNPNKSLSIIFFGFETDVAVAQYLYKICDRAMLWAWMDYKAKSDYKQSTTKQRKAIQNGFDVGMANRINERLRAMKDEQRRENSASGRDLVIVKGPIVEAEMERLGISIGRARAGGSRPMDGAAYRAGQDAGAAVAFNKGVGSNPAGRIG